MLPPEVLNPPPGIPQVTALANWLAGELDCRGLVIAAIDGRAGSTVGVVFADRAAAEKCGAVLKTVVATLPRATDEGLALLDQTILVN